MLLSFALGLSVCLLLALAVIIAVLRRNLNQLKETSHRQEQNLRHELYARLQPIEKRFYDSLPGAEKVVYDGQMKASDFEGRGSQAWDYTTHSFTKDSGAGSHEVNGGTLTVHRTNKNGRYELTVLRFPMDGEATNVLPATSAKDIRRLRLSFEVKRGIVSHHLRLVFKGEVSKEVLDEKDYIAFHPDWQRVDLFFNIPTTEDCLFRIDDLAVTMAPSSVQIRQLRLYEKA